MDYKRILRTANHDELRESMAKCMILTYTQIDGGLYGFTGYDLLRKTLLNLPEEDKKSVAEYIECIREDNKLINLQGRL
jgi:hypothetical protein